MRRNRLTSWAAVAAVAAVASAGPGVPAASAAEIPAYIASASAHGVRSTYTLPGQVVVEEVWDYGGPVAESRVDVSGGSGFASLPFPGAAGVVGAGLVLNLAGLSDTVPTPEYPFYASAHYPATPSTQVGEPGGNYALTAKADQNASTSAAEFRGGPKEGFVGAGLARTDINEVDGAVVVDAESVNKAISIGDGALTIGSVLSKATATLSPEGAVEGTSQLLVEGVEVGGSPAGLSPEGLDTESLNQALAPLGLSVRLVHGETSATGVSADALEIRFVHPIPEGGGNEGTVAYRFGGATASIVTGSAPAADETVGGTPAQPAATPVPPAAPAPSALGAPVPAPPSAALAMAPAAKPTGPVAAAPSADAVSEPVPPALRLQPAAAVSSADPTGASDDWTSSYRLLTLGAVILAASLLTWLRRGGTSWNIS